MAVQTLASQTLRSGRELAEALAWLFRLWLVRLRLERPVKPEVGTPEVGTPEVVGVAHP